MNTPTADRTLTAAVGIALAISIVGAVFVMRFVRLLSPSPAAAPVDRPLRVESTNGVPMDRALREQADLFDPRPLFLPTKFNSSQPDLPRRVRREPGQIFQAFPDEPVFAKDTLDLPTGELVAVPTTPIEAAETGKIANPYFDLGQRERAETPLPGRLACLEIDQAGTGRRVLTVSIPLPEKTVLPTVLWHPIELLAQVDDAGLIGPPTFVTGSGFEEVDTFFRQFLARGFHLGERLTSGIYVVKIGP